MTSKAKRPPSQFSLFGGEDAIQVDPAASEGAPASETGEAAADDAWVYPPDAFPPDPWPPFLLASARDFAAAQGNPAELRRALCRYLKRGAELAEHEALIDALGISADNVLEHAGLDSAEALEVMRVLGTLTAREIESVPLD